MTEKNTNEYKECIYYCYGNFCNRMYSKERRAFGYASVTDYKCTKKCYLFKKRTWINRFLAWLSQKFE